MYNGPKVSCKIILGTLRPTGQSIYEVSVLISGWAATSYCEIKFDLEDVGISLFFPILMGLSWGHSLSLFFLWENSKRKHPSKIAWTFRRLLKKRVWNAFWEMWSATIFIWNLILWHSERKHRSSWHSSEDQLSHPLTYPPQSKYITTFFQQLSNISFHRPS